MKTIKLLILLLLVGIQSQGQNRMLTVSDIQDSGCLSYVRAEGAQNTNSPAIVLEKEGNVLSVELQYFVNNCGTRLFDMAAELHDGWKGASYSDSVVVQIVPVIPRQSDCSCPYNVSFKVQGVESNKLYLTCWWYDGLVELTEGEPLVLENVTEIINVDGAKYRLIKNFNQAILQNASLAWEGEFRIPSEITYQEQTYPVIGFQYYTFHSKQKLTKVTIPSTIKTFRYKIENTNDDDYVNPFSNCLALETIEVEEGNAALQSINGVLFDKKNSALLAYPAASNPKAYKVPDGVKILASSAFNNCSNLTSIEMPLGLKSIGYGAFENCTSLKTLDIPESVTRIEECAFMGTQLTELYIRGVIDSIYLYRDPIIDYHLFGGISPNTKIYVLPSEVERYESIFGRTFYPLPSSEQPQNIRELTTTPAVSPIFDLQGRRLNTEPKHGVYIRNGKKVVK